MIMGMTGVLSKAFLYGFNKVEVTGLTRFLDILDSRRDPANRKRGLLTGAMS
jgi:monolysocardiolipin acyltransferase